MHLRSIYGWIGVLILLVVVGVAFVYPRHPAREVAQCPGQPLLCPDGSLVMPQGTGCTYDPCANTGPLTGELRRVGGSYQLMLAAPTATTQEVSYVLPLQVADASSLAPLVGKRVTVSGAFAEGNTLMVEHYALAQNPDPTVGQVAVGQTAFINGVRITLVSVTNDSRCPLGVACIRAGSVSAEVILRSDTDATATTLASDAAPLGFDAFLISILDVQPPRTQGAAPAQSAYILTIKVANTPTPTR